MLAFALAAALPWESWRPATCLPDDCFCEALGDGLIRQPANAWSSLAFVVVSLWVAVRISRRGRSNSTALAPTEAGLFAGSLLVVGTGSAFYHASLTFIGQVFDVSGMYLVATFILLHRLGPRFGVSPLLALIGFVLANAALMAVQVTTPALRRIVFGVLLASALAAEWRGSRAGRTWLASGAGLAALGFAFWVVDRERWVCEPQSLIQGHSLWHVLGALASACLYRSYEEEAREA